MSLQHKDNDNKEDPMQSLYARRVRQLRERNDKIMEKNKDLDQRTTELKQIFESINSAANPSKSWTKMTKKPFRKKETE